MKCVKYEIEYVELINEKPFEEFVLSLTLKERAKIFETINHFRDLKSNNLPVKDKLSKHLDDGIFELRTYLENKIARVLYFYQRGAKIIITHGFIKKTRKTPKREINRAKDLRKRFDERNSNDELR